MDKEIRDLLVKLNQRLKDRHSAFRFSVVSHGMYKKIQKCGVRYHKGKELLVTVSVIYDYISKAETIRILTLMNIAVNSINCATCSFLNDLKSK